MVVKFTNEDFDKRLIEKGSSFVRIGNYTNAKSKIEVKCACGNIVFIRAGNLLSGMQKMCKRCADKKPLMLCTPKTC